MKSRSIKNCGYLLALVPQILFVVGFYLGLTWLPILIFFAVLPVVRTFVGNDLSPSNERPSRLLTIYFKAIPRVYCVAWTFVLPWTIWVLATKTMSLQQYLGFTLGFWVVCSLNTVVTHELIHSRSKIDRILGNLLGASVGYFHFPEEHLSHHATNGHAFTREGATPGTSIYSYAWDRYRRSWRMAWEYEISRLRRQVKSWPANRLMRRAMIPVMIAVAFYLFAGILGLCNYLFQVVGTAFTVQAITYLQHWGLSEKETPSLADFGFAWEDGCWMQACVTLNISFHGQHHLHVARPYYKLSQLKGGLTLPASYPVMFVVCLFPRLFTKIMGRRLALWTNSCEKRELLGHDSDCIGMARIVKAFHQG